MDRFLECPRCGFRRRIDVRVLAGGRAGCPSCSARHGAPVLMTIAPHPRLRPDLRSRPGH